MVWWHGSIHYMEKYGIWYGMLVVWFDGTMWWVHCMAKYFCLVVWYVSVCKVCRSRIRRTNIICYDLIYRSLEHVRKYVECGQPDRQTDEHIGLQLPKQRLSFTNWEFYNGIARPGNVLTCLYHIHVCVCTCTDISAQLSWVFMICLFFSYRGILPFQSCWSLKRVNI